MPRRLPLPAGPTPEDVPFDDRLHDILRTNGASAEEAVQAVQAVRHTLDQYAPGAAPGAALTISPAVAASLGLVLPAAQGAD